jgi:hypothetical protein
VTRGFIAAGAIVASFHQANVGIQRARFYLDFANGCAALRGSSGVATHIDVCFACRRRLPIAIGDSVVRGIDRVDPQFRL